MKCGSYKFDGNRKQVRKQNPVWKKKESAGKGNQNLVFEEDGIGGKVKKVEVWQHGEWIMQSQYLLIVHDDRSDSSIL